MGTVTGSHARFLVSLLSHHKVKRAGALVVHLWMLAVMWANAHPERDGRIPLDVLLDLCPDVAKGVIGERSSDGVWIPTTPLDLLQRGVEVRLFDPIEVETGIGEVVPVHDYLDHNKSGEERAAASRTKAEAAHRRHEQAPPTPQDPNTGRFSGSHALNDAPHGPNHATRTEPPVPTPTSPSASRSTSALSSQAAQRDLVPKTPSFRDLVPEPPGHREPERRGNNSPKWTDEDLSAGVALAQRVTAPPIHVDGCSDYVGHRSDHRQLPSGKWICMRCSPTVAATPNTARPRLIQA